jgi:hypothetical protein
MNQLTWRHRKNGQRLSFALTWVVLPTMVFGLLKGPTAGAGSGVTVFALPGLLALPGEEAVQVEVGRMNLLCAKGLPGADRLEVGGLLTTLDSWAQRANAETERQFYRFRKDPAEFEHSEGSFRMLMLMVVLTEDFGVHYKQGARTGPEAARPADGFFADARDVFLHGLLGPERQGTCSSLPVLYVAIGRRLGYPLKLVTTRAHLFVRWEDSKERFNVEVSGQGLNRFDDAYYRKWPFPVTEEEVQAEGYLKSLNPPEELALFLSIRGMCWLEAGKKTEAAESFAAAARLSPGCRSYCRMAEKLEREAAPHPDKPGLSVFEVGRGRWARPPTHIARIPNNGAPSGHALLPTLLAGKPDKEQPTMKWRSP